MVPVVGFVNGRSPDVSARSVAAFLKGLNETGYVARPGGNLTGVNFFTAEVVAKGWGFGMSWLQPALITTDKAEETSNAQL